MKNYKLKADLHGIGTPYCPKKILTILKVWSINYIFIPPSTDKVCPVI